MWSHRQSDACVHQTMCLHCFSTWCISALDVNSQYHVFPQYWNCLSNTVRSLRRSALLRADWWTGSSKNENVKLREKLRFVTCLRGGKRGGLGGCLGGSGLRFTLALWPFSGSVFVIWGGGGGGGGSGAVIGFEWARGRGETGGGKLVKEDSEWEEPSQGVMLSGATDEMGGWPRFLVSAWGVEREGLAKNRRDEKYKNLNCFEACFCYW